MIKGGLHLRIFLKVVGRRRRRQITVAKTVQVVGVWYGIGVWYGVLGFNDLGKLVAILPRDLIEGGAQFLRPNSWLSDLVIQKYDLMCHYL